MALYKRTNVPTLVGILRKHFNDSQLTAKEIEKCVMADLVDWSPNIRTFIVRYDISKDVQMDLDAMQRECAYVQTIVHH